MLARIGRALVGYHHRAIHLPRVERLAAVLAGQIGQAESLLDVGAGDGRLARSLAAAVGATRVAGVDVAVRPEAALPTVAYDGGRLPFADQSFEIVLLSDVVHHAAEPTAVLGESLRVAARAVALKDHVRFGRVSTAVLYAMDCVGNVPLGVPVRGRYFSWPEWIDLLHAADGRLRSLRWPVEIHALPWRLVTRSAYQFTALVERAPSRERAPRPETARTQAGAVGRGT